MNLLLDLMLTFAKIGATTFGGGYAMIPLIQDQLVGKGWLTLAEVTDMVAISEMTPGPFAINVATFAGMKVMGIPGAIVCTLGVTLPSLIIISAVATIFKGVQESRGVQGALRGIHPAAVGLIGTAVFTIGAKAFFPTGVAGGIDFRALLLAGGVLIALQRWKVNPIAAIFLSGLIGLVIY